MPFNSDTYKANRYARQAYRGIAEAKNVKRRAAAGDAYAWQIERIPLLVRGARLDMHISLIYRRSAAFKRSARR